MPSRYAAFDIVDADTRLPVRYNRFTSSTVLDALAKLISRHPSRDYLIVDEDGFPVPKSRIQQHC